MTAPTHYALIHDVDNTAEIIAAGDADFCDRELHAWLDVHPLTETQTAEVVAREMTYAQGGIIPGDGPALARIHPGEEFISRAQLDALAVDPRTLVASRCTCPPSANLGEGEHLPTCQEAAA